MLEVGKKAPEFKGIIEDESSIALNDLAGKKVVLYFYPKDDTPGCTAESCDLRDNHERLLAQGFVIYGVSPDSPKSHVKFIDKYSLPFSLISDESHEICEAYEAWGEKNMFGRKFHGVLRKTYIIDDKGIITDIIKKVDTANHTAQIID